MSKLYIVLPVVLLFIFNCATAFSQNKFDTYINQGFDSFKQHRYGAAFNLFQQAKALEGTGNGFNESVYYALGLTFKAFNAVDSAVRYYEKSIQFYKANKDSANLSHIYMELGLIALNYTNKYDDAINYFHQQALYLVPQKDTAWFECLQNIGSAYEYKGRYDSALKYFGSILHNYSPVNTVRNLALISIADTYFEIDREGDAFNYYNTAIRTCKKGKDSLNLFTALVNKGHCLMVQNRLNLSLECFKDAEHYFNDSTTDDQKQALWYNLSEVYGKNGDFEKAYYYRRLESNLNDNIKNERITRASTDATAKFEVQKYADSATISRQQTQLANAKSEVADRKFIITLLSAIGVTLLGLLSLRNALLRRKANRRISAEKVKVETLAGELQEANQTKARLFSIISHDLRSPVSSLYAALKMQEINGSNTVNEVVISDQIMNLLDTLEDLLTWSKSQMDRFNLQPVAVAVNSLYTS